MDLTQELFQSIKLIVEHELSQQKTTSTIIGTVIEKVSSSEAYKVSYQNIEIIASSLGGIYSPGDSVYILLPNGVLGDVKFIVGKTNDRTPTVAKSGNGLSDSTMSMIQNIINSFTEWSSDNSISPIEKASLALQWETIKSSYAEALAQAKEYPEVPVVSLINKYDNLKRLVEPLLSNMGTTSSLNGEELRLALGEYLSEDSAVRLLVQEELKKELVYKTTIVSSGGNSFKNGIINTTLSTISMRGRKNIDKELGSNQIRWTKLNGDGSEEVGSETFGFTREINSDDVHVKQIFRVEIIIGGIIVAQDYITLVDLNDIENIDLTITTGGSTKQIFNPDTNTIIPDYTKENQVMFARVFKGKEDLSQIADIKWFYNGTPIVSDGRFLVEGYKLTILKNLTNTENPVILIKCSASYYSSEYQMVLEDEEVTEFLFISKGATGASATSYWITASNNIIGKSQTGVINPTTITFKGFSKTGTANSVAYSGRFIIQTSTNGTTYTNSYVSNNTNENTKTYTIPANALFVKCLFYMAGGTKILLDEQTVPIVESAEGIQVGGRNLVLNTKGEHNPSLGGSNVYTLPLTDSSMFLGKELTFSFKAKSSNGTNKMYISIGTGSQTRNKITEDIVIPIDYKEFKYTFIASTSTDTTKLMIVAGTSWFPDNDGSITITDIKLEKGNKATDWTPAPEDVDKAISTVQANLTVEAGKIASKVSQSEFDAVENRLDSAESTITQQASKITLRVTKTELTTAIDGIEVGTRNLLRDSNVEFSFGEDDNKYIWDAYRDNTWEVLGD